MQNDALMKQRVTDLLKNKLPHNYFYHDVRHTLYVLDKAIEIANHEKCTEKEIQLISAAALWHDTGFINVYLNHEEEGCKFARASLPGYEFTEQEINAICGMIMATKIPQLPKNKLEEMIADADLEYLGTGDASVKADLLFRELQSINPLLTKDEWNETQIRFLQSHHYFTNYCKEKSEPVKMEYLQSLITKR